MLRKYHIYPLRMFLLYQFSTVPAFLEGGRRESCLRVNALALIFLIGCHGSSGNIPFVRRFANIPKEMISFGF